MPDYPLDWADISLKVRRKAGFKCENCGHVDNALEGRLLTVHHLDRNTKNNSYWNLAALCQRCHLSLQGKFRPGQLPLLDPPRWLARHISGLKGQAKTLAHQARKRAERSAPPTAITPLP